MNLVHEFMCINIKYLTNTLVQLKDVKFLIRKPVIPISCTRDPFKSCLKIVYTWAKPKRNFTKYKQ